MNTKENTNPTLVEAQAPRKRGRPRKNPLPVVVQGQAPRKRGRPRKNPLTVETQSVTATTTTPVAAPASSLDF